MNRVLVLPMLFLVACASSMTPRANTRDEIIAYVDRAAQIVQENGPSCEMFAQDRWRTGDWYIFVLSGDAKTLCHASPAMVGSDVNAIVDANGFRLGAEFMKVASGPEHTMWVDYVWARPGMTTPEPKTSYVRRVPGPDGKVYVVGSGGYGLPRNP